MQRRSAAIVWVVVVVLVMAGGLTGWRWWHQRSPYGPEVLVATATLRLVDQATADAAFDGQQLELSGDGAQVFLGQVAWTPPPQAKPGTMLMIVVLDKRSQLMPGLISATSDRPDRVGAGFDGVLNAVEQQHPWLYGIGAREINGGLHSAGSVVTVSSLDATPVTFSFVLHPARPETPPEFAVASAPAAVDDLMVALISVGPDRQVYWAQRLLH
ncbi:hypothetical protein O7632_08185 [Solwaraspora sp. WMMD406]|uniref:hypothetical protein n=1 Tax=Solwaraspora sp. WMMD406 TaxID=3016095 RepID=UPI002417BDDD|nr:hypothetical protein [Solwaraspora sp. WMMD406]MDG4764083.1 hypothetical protein [Solwaraspora sp. WMMD406]